MESQHPVGWPTCHDFPRFLIISEISRPEVRSRWRRWPKSCLFWKRPLTGKFSKMFSERIHADIDPRLVCKFREIWPTGSRWNRVCLPDKKKQNFGSRSRSRFCADRANNLSEPDPDNLFGVSQISSIRSLPAHSWTRERRWNAPQSVCNTRRSYSFFAE